MRVAPPKLLPVPDRLWKSERVGRQMSALPGINERALLWRDSKWRADLVEGCGSRGPGRRAKFFSGTLPVAQKDG